MTKILLTGVAILISGVACGHDVSRQSESPSPTVTAAHYASLGAVHSALARTGFPCVLVISHAQAQLAPKTITGFAYCRLHDGSLILLGHFKDAAERDRLTAPGDGREAYGVNWTVNAESHELALSIAKALGGSVR
jgi:hypothetical protein